MRLPVAMIGVLAEDDDAYPVERGQIERTEIFDAPRKNLPTLLLFLQQEPLELGHVTVAEFPAQNGFPAFFQPDRRVHVDRPPPWVSFRNLDA